MMYIVAGTGDMPGKEAREILEDQWELLEQETPAGEPIMVSFLITPQSPPGAAHTALMGFLRRIEIPFGLITPDGSVLSEESATYYEGYDDVYSMDVSEVTKDLITQGEPVRLLALFETPEQQDPADEDIEKQVELSVAAGAQAWLMNAAMFEIALTPGGDDEEEPATTPAAPAAQKTLLDEDPEPTPEPTPEPKVDQPLEDIVKTVYTPTGKLLEEDLQGLTRAELTALARELDVTPKDWRTKQFIIDAITGKEASESTDTDSDTTTIDTSDGFYIATNAVVNTIPDSPKVFTYPPGQVLQTDVSSTLSQSQLTAAVRDGVLAALRELVNGATEHTK